MLIYPHRLAAPSGLYSLLGERCNFADLPGGRKLAVCQLGFDIEDTRGPKTEIAEVCLLAAVDVFLFASRSIIARAVSRCSLDLIDTSGSS